MVSAAHGDKTMYQIKIESQVTLPGFEDIVLPENLELKLPDLLAKLQFYQVGNPVKSKVLETWYKLTGVSIRKMINKLRYLGYPIGSTSQGYFYATNQDQLDTTIKHLKLRAEKMMQLVASLEQCYRVQPIEVQTTLFKSGGEGLQ
jgi:biotin operon repressor